MAPLSSDPNVNVRVVAVAPGIIKTPIWLESPDKMRLLTENDTWISPEFVAETMCSLIEQDEIEVVSKSPTNSSGSAIGDTKDGLTKVKVTGGMIVEVGYK